VDRGTGTSVNYGIKVHAEDTNGTVDTVYWSSDATFNLGTAIRDDSILTRTIDDVHVQNVIRYWIYARDDDGLLRGQRFIVYCDSAPPRPSNFNGMQPVADSIVLKWDKRQDYKDGMQTKVQVLTCYGNDCTPTDSLFPSNALPTLTEIEYRWGTASGGTWNVVKLKKDPTKQTGTFGRWRVILVDARGTATIGPNPAGDPATFEVP